MNYEDENQKKIYQTMYILLLGNYELVPSSTYRIHCSKTMGEFLLIFFAFFLILALISPNQPVCVVRNFYNHTSEIYTAKEILKRREVGGE